MLCRETFRSINKVIKLSIDLYIYNLFNLNWRIITLQYCVGFCHVSTWISHRYTYVCSWLYNHSVPFSRSVVSDSLRPHESQHARLHCPSQTPGVYSNSCSSSWWCHLAISSSVISFSSCPQSLPASGSFPMSQLFSSGGQSLGVSASALVLPMNTQDWSSGWTGWISLQSKGLKSLLQHHSSKASIFQHSTLTSINDHWKNHSLTKWIGRRQVGVEFWDTSKVDWGKLWLTVRDKGEDFFFFPARTKHTHLQDCFLWESSHIV